MKVMLKEIGNIITGNTPSKNSKEFWNSKDICFIKPDIIADAGVYEICESNEYISECARKKARIVSKDSIFVTCIGSIGKIGITGEGEYAFNQQINAIVPNKKVNPRYLAYNLLFNKSRLIAIANAPVVPIINKSQFGEFVISIESDISEQSKIVDILDKLSSLIEKYNGEIVALDKLVKARFVEMFGDPVSNPYELPVVKLAELSELITKGASPSWQGFSYTDDSSQTLFVTSENVRGGFLDLSSPKYIEDGFNDKQKRSMIHKGDFLINIVGASIGRAAQFNLECKANMNQASALVRINDNRIIDKYLLVYLNSDKAQRMYDSMKSDTGRANLSIQDINDLTIMLPPLDKQIEYETFVQQVNKSKVEVKKALDEAQLLFDSLMQKYFG